MQLLRRGIVTGARGVTTDDKREQVGCFHCVNDKNAGRSNRGGKGQAPAPIQGSLERGVGAELRRSGDQLMMPRWVLRKAATIVRYASIAFIAHRIV